MVPLVVRVPLVVGVIIPEIERVSPKSGSVSFERSEKRLFVESSVTVGVSLLAVGAELVQEIVIVPVAVFERDPLASMAL